MGGRSLEGDLGREPERADRTGQGVEGSDEERVSWMRALMCVCICMHKRVKTARLYCSVVLQYCSIVESL